MTEIKMISNLKKKMDDSGDNGGGHPKLDLNDLYWFLNRLIFSFFSQFHMIFGSD
jgi:hypothetical protein